MTCRLCGGCGCHDAVPWVRQDEAPCQACGATVSTRQRCPVRTGVALAYSGYISKAGRYSSARDSTEGQ